MIEVLVVVAIVAVIAGIALPNYQDHLRRSRRTDAMIALQQIAAKQEQFYFDNNRYGGSLASIGARQSSPDGYYSLTLWSDSPDSYVARATPAAGGLSASGRFEIRSDGSKRWDPDEDGVFQCGWHGVNRAGAGC